MVRWFLASFAVAVVIGQVWKPEPPFYADKAKLLVYRDGDKDVPITTAADWAKRREHILANMQLVMGPLPDAAPRCRST